MSEPRGLTRTSPERRLFPSDVGPFDLVPFNQRPAPQVKVTGFGDTPDGPLVFLGCGHSLPMELADDIPLNGSTVSCWRCRDDAPLKADGAIRRGD